MTLTRIANTNAQPQFNQITRTRAGTIQFTATGLPGLTYTMQANAELTTANWATLGAITADALGQLVFTDASAGLYPARFYRCVWP